MLMFYITSLTTTIGSGRTKLLADAFDARGTSVATGGGSSVDVEFEEEDPEREGVLEEASASMDARLPDGREPEP